ncbi:MAG: peptidase S41 [Chloroflexi bacterium]|nr:peptidase S41 [Chloroflexota bacterium]
MKKIFPLNVLLILLISSIILNCQQNTLTETILPEEISEGLIINPQNYPNQTPEIIIADKPINAPNNVPEELAPIWETWNYLSNDHVDRSSMDSKKLTEEAIIAILKTFNDQGTYYIPPNQFKIQNEDMGGDFEGIGAHVSIKADGSIMIVAPIEGSPAEKAGIKPGDLILAIEGISTKGIGLLEAVNKIRGPKGTSVRLQIKHVGELDPVNITIKRDVIPLESVIIRTDENSPIAHIKITNFYSNTSQQLQEALNKVKNYGTKGIIIDVRNNPGGFLNSAIDVTSQFLDEGIALYEIDGKGNRVNWKIRKNGIATEIPLVILANEYSASASEILVGAIQDYKRGTIIGKKTFGKGSVNIIRKLSNGGGIGISISRFYSPLGRLIEDNGLDPDIIISNDDKQKEEAEQLNEAFKILNNLIYYDEE